MRRILVILNPAAKGEKAVRMAERIAKLSPEAELRQTTRHGEAREWAEAAVGNYDAIVAAGGDGTINDVVNGIARSETPLGILPIGTMNVFAAELGLPRDLRQCWRIIHGGKTRDIDLARAGKRFFVQMGGVGLDAQIVEETPWAMRKNLGPLSYLVSGAQIASRPPPRLEIKADGRERTGSFVLIGNGRYYGGPVPIFKEARIDDGLLDVLIFKNLGYLDIVRYLNGIVFGNHTKMKDVVYFQTPRVEVHCPDRVPIEVDGEVVGATPVTFRISRRKLRVLAPSS